MRAQQFYIRRLARQAEQQSRQAARVARLLGDKAPQSAEEQKPKPTKKTASKAK